MNRSVFYIVTSSVLYSPYFFFRFSESTVFLSLFSTVFFYSFSVVILKILQFFLQFFSFTFFCRKFQKQKWKILQKICRKKNMLGKPNPHFQHWSRRTNRLTRSFPMILGDPDGLCTFWDFQPSHLRPLAHGLGHCGSCRPAPPWSVCSTPAPSAPARRCTSAVRPWTPPPCAPFCAESSPSSESSARDSVGGTDWKGFEFSIFVLKAP